MTDRTLTKGLALLELLIVQPELDGVTKLARALGWVPSNVHRTLQTLVDCGYVSVHQGHYSATLRLWTLGSLVSARLDIKSILAPVLAAIAHETQESAHLSVLDGGEVVYIDKVESPQPVRAYSRIGGRAPAYAVATGKALLAHQSNDVIQRLAPHLQPFTSSTITEVDLLTCQLSGVRESGVAFNRGEWRDQVWGIASPVIDAEGRVVAAIGISGPADRFGPISSARFVSMVQDAGRRASALMGFAPTRVVAREATL